MTNPLGPVEFTIAGSDGAPLETCRCGHGVVVHMGPLSADPRSGEGWLECTMCDCGLAVQWDPYAMRREVRDDGEFLVPE